MVGAESDSASDVAADLEGSVVGTAARLAVEFRQPGPLRVESADVRGRTVARLVEGGLAFAGEHAFRLPDLAPGVGLIYAISSGASANQAFVVAR